MIKLIKKIIPQKQPDDQLYNRRLMSYAGLIFSVFWFQEILIIIVLGYFFKIELSAATVTALLTVPATLAGLGFWRYLEACKIDDCNTKGPHENKESPEGLPDSAGLKNAEIPPADSSGQEKE